MHEAEQNDEEKDQYFGLSLRELVHTYKWQTLVLFKCLLLQPKVNRQDGKHQRSQTDIHDRCCSLAHIARKCVKYNSPYFLSYPALFESYRTVRRHILTHMDELYEHRIA